MKVRKYFMRTRMHGTPTGRPDYQEASVTLDVRGDVFVRFLLTLIRSLIGRRWSMFDWYRPWKKRSIAHKKFNIRGQISIQHLQTFSIIKDSLQCTDIDLMMYRNGTSHVLKSYYKKHMYRNWSHMYRSRHVPKLSTPLYRNCHVPLMFL